MTSEATFRHLASRRHHEAVHTFWKATGAPAKEKDQFLLSRTQWHQARSPVGRLDRIIRSDDGPTLPTALLSVTDLSLGVTQFEQACERAAQKHAEEEGRRQQAQEEHIQSLLAGDLCASFHFHDSSPSLPYSAPSCSACSPFSTVVDFPSSGDTPRAHIRPQPLGPHLPAQDTVASAPPAPTRSHQVPTLSNTIASTSAAGGGARRQTATAFGERMGRLVPQFALGTHLALHQI